MGSPVRCKANDLMEIVEPDQPALTNEYQDAEQGEPGGDPQNAGSDDDDCSSSSENSSDEGNSADEDCHTATNKQTYNAMDVETGSLSPKDRSFSSSESFSVGEGSSTESESCECATCFHIFADNTDHAQHLSELNRSVRSTPRAACRNNIWPVC
jgi:hypothetical protein